MNESNKTTNATVEIVRSVPEFSDPRLGSRPRLRVAEKPGLSTIDISGGGENFFDLCQIGQSYVQLYVDRKDGMEGIGTLGTDYEITLRAFSSEGRADEKTFRTSAEGVVCI